MDTSTIKVSNFRVRDVNVRGEAAAGFESTWGVKQLPLGREKFEFEIAGVPTSVPNAIQRTMMDEMKGYCLAVKDGGFSRIESTDPFMSEKFVVDRIMYIPLRPKLNEAEIKNFKFELHYDNTTTNAVAVFAGDLTPVDCVITQPLFNPTIEIALLQPGKSIHITGIHISEGYGHQLSAFSPVCRCALRPLDIEQYTDAQIRLDRDAIDAPELNIQGKIVIADMSGFKKSSLVANSRRHAVSGWLPAVEKNSDVARFVVVDACSSIMVRLGNIRKMLETDDIQKATQLVVTSTDRGATQGVLTIGESHTVANLIKRSVFELWPDIGFIGYKYDLYTETSRITMIKTQDDDIDDMFVRAIKHTYNIFETIRRQVKAIAIINDDELPLGL